MGLAHDLHELIIGFIIFIIGFILLSSFVKALNFSWGSLLLALFVVLAGVMIIRAVLDL